jgi:hypothetical protein
VARTFVKHGFFSKDHEVLVGSFEMDTPDGQVIRITSLGDTIDAFYPWEDAVYVGVILDGTNRNQSFNSGFQPVLVEPIKNKLKVGDVCVICSAEYKERMLFCSIYVGCHC